MASPTADRLAVTPAIVRPLSITPGSRVRDVSTPATNGRTPFSGDSIWTRLRDAGLDEESIKRRDKAALIAYIAKLEAEIYELHHNMGLLILEKKDWVSKYEQVELSAESAETALKRDQVTVSSALAEARKREDNLKKALGIEKELVANIEKTMHEMRVEYAEVKVAAESKMAEAHIMIEDAQKKYSEAEAKLRAAESLQSEASRYRRAADRKLQEVEAREDDLRRRISSFKYDCDVKEKEIMLERQSLSERQKTFNQAQDRLLDGQALLNEREADILTKSQELKRLQKELEALKENIDTERRTLMLEKSDLDLAMASLSQREKAVIEKEALLIKREQELLVTQEKLKSKELENAQKLMAEQESALKMRLTEFEAGLQMKQKLAEEEIEVKRRAWELRELDLKQREDFVLEREQELEAQSRAMTEKDKDMRERMRLIEERENILDKAERDIALKRLLLQKEKEEGDLKKIDLQQSLHSLEEKKKQIINAETNLEVMKSETSELLILETKLKEEIDIVRMQKLELEAEADKLKVEKAKFESEWELIDEKREELQREEERIAVERSTISIFLKGERESLNLERAALRDQYKHDLESLSGDREAFLSEMQCERSEWFSKIEQERSDLLSDFEMRKRELEDCVDKRREEIESNLREKEKAFEEEKKKELQNIKSLKESAIKEQEYVTLEMKKLEAERMQINLDHERRDKEWAELNSLIDELKTQRQKLKKQRELLHADREEICAQIEHMKEMENLNIPFDRILVPEIEQPYPESNSSEIPAKRFPESSKVQVPKLHSDSEANFAKDAGTLSMHNEQAKNSSTPGHTALSFFRRWMVRHTLDELSSEHDNRSLQTEHDSETLRLAEKTHAKNDAETRPDEGLQSTENRDPTTKDQVGVSGRAVSEEAKVIHEVPSVSEDLRVAHGSESQGEVYAGENSMQTSLSFPSGRKRRIGKSSVLPGDNDTLLSGNEQNNKKRRQVDDNPKSSVDATLHGLEPKQLNTMEIQHGLISLKQSEAITESAETVPDKVGPAEMTTEVADVDECHNRDHPNLVRNLNLDKEVLQDGGSDGQGISLQVEHDAVTHITVEQTIIEEVLLVEDDKMATTNSEGPAINEPSEKGCDDHGDTRSDKQEVVNDRIQTRSRSKQTL
ncbi:hypothetical protein Ancab_026147 [Ancistrocladus abbreviatus]